MINPMWKNKGISIKTITKTTTNFECIKLSVKLTNQPAKFDSFFFLFTHLNLCLLVCQTFNTFSCFSMRQHSPEINHHTLTDWKQNSIVTLLSAFFFSSTTDYGSLRETDLNIEKNIAAIFFIFFYYTYFYLM